MSLNLLVHPPDETSENDVDRNRTEICPSATLPLCPPQFSRGLTWKRIQASVVGLVVYTWARPFVRSYFLLALHHSSYDVTGAWCCIVHNEINEI